MFVEIYGGPACVCRSSAQADAGQGPSSKLMIWWPPAWMDTLAETPGEYQRGQESEAWVSSLSLQLFPALRWSTYLEQLMMSADSHWLSLHLLPPKGAKCFPILLFNQLPIPRWILIALCLQTYSDTLGLLLPPLAPLNGGCKPCFL